MSENAASIIDEINKRIDEEAKKHFMLLSFEKFEPSTIYLTPERYIEFMQELTTRYVSFIPAEPITWRGAEIKVVRDRW